MKFKYGDHARVIRDGFYQDRAGIVVARHAHYQACEEEEWVVGEDRFKAQYFLQLPHTPNETQQFSYDELELVPPVEMNFNWKHPNEKI